MPGVTKRAQIGMGSPHGEGGTEGGGEGGLMSGEAQGGDGRG